MDAAAATASMGLRKPMGFASSCCSSSRSKELKTDFPSVMVGRKKPACQILSSGFCDQGHQKYYSSGSSGMMMTIMSGKQEKIAKEKGSMMKKKKKQLKLLKGLYKDLSTFSQMGFGLDSNGDLVDQIKGGMISEATENLLKHLQKLRAEEKELKKKMKEEKARLKAAQMRNNLANCEMAAISSSSSESSDSECGEVLNMNTLRHSQSNQNDLRQVLEEAISSYPTPIIPTITPSQPNIPEAEPLPVVPTNTITEEKTSLQLTSPCSRTGDLAGEMIVPNCSKKIEVCMGGKCKRSGAGALLEEFQRVVGLEGAVSGCKCMGKCRDGPNVKIVNGVADDSVRVAANSLCLGVGLEDVNMILANFLGENQDQLGFAAVT